MDTEKTELVPAWAAIDSNVCSPADYSAGWEVV